MMAGAAPAIASDAADVLPIGYSADGRYFAFEQFGVQDGSGFPYSDIFVLDLDNNSWVDGAPIRVLVEDESAKLSAARSQSAAKAAAVIAKYKITDTATMLAATPATEVSDDRGTVTFDANYRYMGGAVPIPNHDLWYTRYKLNVAGFNAAPLPEHCKDYGDPIAALSVELTDVKSGKKLATYKDQSVPKSRGCPTGYDVGMVVAPADYTQSERLVVIVGIYTFGFEGQDRRFLAVPMTPE